MSVLCVRTQIRSSIITLLFSGREFSWIRHMVIAAGILAFNNLLVIFVPTIRDIFGFIGEPRLRLLWSTGNCLCNSLCACCVWVCHTQQRCGTWRTHHMDMESDSRGPISTFRSGVILLRRWKCRSLKVSARVSCAVSCVSSLRPLDPSFHTQTRLLKKAAAAFAQTATQS